MEMEEDYLFTANLVLYLQMCHRAEGIGYNPAYVDDLIRLTQDEADRYSEDVNVLTRAAFHKGFVEQGEREIQALIAGATTPQRQRQVLPAIQRLYAQIEGKTAELEQLAAQQTT